MNGKIIGATLLILGTSIGAGMIALPVAAAQINFVSSLGLLFVSWLIMTFGAFALLEATLWFGKGTNLTTIAKHTLGRPGQIATWFIYLFLLYGLLCAYISGISDVVHVILNYIHIYLPQWLEVVVTVALLSFAIYRGIKSVDLLNRGLMSAKFIIYVVIAALVVGKLSPAHFNYIYNGIHLTTLMVVITSFGYAIIIPTLVDYLDRDAKVLHRVVLIGSIIPMLIYALWIAIIQGVIPQQELIAISQQGRTMAELLLAMQKYSGTQWIASLVNVFMSICAFTSFLGVSLSLVDFLADGTKLDKRSNKGKFIYLLAFVPPMLVVIFDPNVFIKALSYAGILCVLLLIILPLLMIIGGRYWKHYSHEYKVWGGKVSLAIGLTLAVILLLSLLFYV